MTQQRQQQQPRDAQGIDGRLAATPVVSSFPTPAAAPVTIASAHNNGTAAATLSSSEGGTGTVVVVVAVPPAPHQQNQHPPPAGRGPAVGVDVPNIQFSLPPASDAASMPTRLVHSAESTNDEMNDISQRDDPQQRLSGSSSHPTPMIAATFTTQAPSPPPTSNEDEAATDPVEAAPKNSTTSNSRHGVGCGSVRNPQPSLTVPAAGDAGGVSRAENIGLGGGGGRRGRGVLPLDSETVENIITNDDDAPSPPFVDPAITPAVHSIIHLLQLYGPLSYEQLKFNMVPQLVDDPSIPPSTSTNGSAVARGGGAATAMAGAGTAAATGLTSVPRRKRDKLQKVLDILYELGVIHLVDTRKLTATVVTPLAPVPQQRRNVPKESAAAVLGEGREEMLYEERDVLEADGPNDAVAPEQRVPTTTTTGDKVEIELAAGDQYATAPKLPSAAIGTKKLLEDEVYNDPNPIYCFGNGIPRMDVVQPMDILNEIREAGQEVLRINQRIEILREVLMITDNEEDEQQHATAKEDKATGTSFRVVGVNEAESAVTATAAAASVSITNFDKHNKFLSPHQNASQVLKQIYQLHPEIANDPVYAAALRMFRVNVGTSIDHHKMFVENNPEIERIRQTILNGTNSSKLHNKSSSNRRRSASTSDKSLRRTSSDDGLRMSSGGNKKRKKGRPPKNSTSSDKLSKKADGGVGGEEAPMVSAGNATWA